MIMKEQINLVFNGCNLCYYLAHSVAFLFRCICWGAKTFYRRLRRYFSCNYSMLHVILTCES